MDRWNQYELFFTASIKDKLSEVEVNKYVKPLYEAEGLGSVYDWTQKKKMLPFVANMLVSSNIDAEKWNYILEQFRNRNTDVRNELALVFKEMEDAGVKKLFVSENFGALLNSGRDIALFASGDLDTCADLSEKGKIDSVFESLGYAAKDHYSGKTLCSTSYYNQQRLPDDFYIGVCWEPLSRLKLPCFINMNDFVDWDNLREVEGTAIKLPSAEALLYICLMHITLHSFHRAPAIRLYADILNSCYRNDIDWEKVYGWAKRDKTVTRMMTSAILANKLADVSIPEFVKAYEKDKRVQRLLGYTYNSEAECLNPEPLRLGVLRIEVSCNDRNQLAGIKEMLYPGAEWLKEHYGHGALASSLLHFKNII